MAKQTLNETIKMLQKEYDSIIPDLTGITKIFPHIQSGSLVVDLLTGINGFPIGRITEIAGEFSSGKTTLALHAAADIQKMGRVVVYADWEQALDVNYAKALGVDLTPVEEGGKFILLTPETLEDGWEALHHLLQHNEIGLVVLDSVSAMMPRDMFNEDMEASHRIALQASLLNKQWIKLVQECRNIDCVALVLNQMRTTFKTTPYGTTVSEESTGGVALKFYSSIRIFLKISGRIKGSVLNQVSQIEEEGVIGQKVTATFRKNKMGNPLRAGQFFVRYGTGADNIYSLMTVAIEKDLIKQTGAYFIVPGMEKKVQGMEQLRAYLETNKELCQSLATEIGWDTKYFK